MFRLSRQGLVHGPQGYYQISYLLTCPNCCKPEYWHGSDEGEVLKVADAVDHREPANNRFQNND